MHNEFYAREALIQEVEDFYKSRELIKTVAPTDDPIYDLAISFSFFCGILALVVAIGGIIYFIT